MARRKKAEIEEFSAPKLSEGAVRGIVSISAVVVAILLLLSAVGKAGIAGGYAYGGLEYLVGVGFFLLPLSLLVLAYLFTNGGTSTSVSSLRGIGAALFIVAALGLIDLVVPHSAGIIGHAIASPLVTLLDLYASGILLIGLVVIALLLTFDAKLDLGIVDWVRSLRTPKEPVEAEEAVPEHTYGEGENGAQEDLPPQETEDQDEMDASGMDEAEMDESEPGQSRLGGLFGRGKNAAAAPPTHLFGPYTPPPLSLLERDKGKPSVGDTKANANLIKRTLQNFGIRVEMDEINVGPTVTRYSLKPAEGVRLSKIVSLQSNLELALAAAPLRIEAPIPGKSLVGIEVPNIAKATVGIAALMGAPEFTENPKPLLVTLGRDITGTPQYADIGKMPHALVAGTTGSGKSVTIHSIITSLLYRNGPERLRLVLIDPKRVELTLYGGIPHLYNTPVITDAKKAILALKWAAKEMDRRYDILEAHRVRDIGSYHATVLPGAMKKHEKEKAKYDARESDTDESGSLIPSPVAPDAMPHIVIIIDELADIMQTYPRELEASIVRLAQMSRAVGIHLILSTQRPSVNVITGLIKANIPSRIALQVSSQIDSRTILDASGAEKLLGAGDMLFLSGDMAKPRRLQSPFISEAEVKKVVDFLMKHNEIGLESGISFTGEENTGASDIFSSMTGDDDPDGESDPLYEEARRVVMEAGRASTSLLQRRLKVGYGRGARLMDLLEERGVIAPSDGTNKPREVMGAGSGGASDDETV